MTTYSRCTAQRRNGSFCDAETAPDMPFPICPRHAIQVFTCLNDTLERVAGDPLEDLYFSMLATDTEDRRRERERNAEPTVYYARVGEFIKIGHSDHVKSRIHGYPPGTELLATEPGDIFLERQRHRQFADDLLAGREWFSPSPALMAHIAALQEVAA